ncbi:hypothetical protein RCIP0047_00073 [Klebsiella phage RCIP0047]
MWQMANAVIVGGNKMYKMSKKSKIGRIIVLPAFIIILAAESILNKADNWNYSVRRLRVRMTEWVDKKFPLG